MEDLLECPVCMDRYTLDGDKLPRVFVCEHTFCHSCIKNLVQRGNSVTCPTCRHKHHCNKVERLPRNLTLLQLIESGCGKPPEDSARNTNGRCGECLKNKVFCEKCTIASEENECRSCLKKKLSAQVAELQKLLTKGKELCEAIPEHSNDHLMKRISEITANALSDNRQSKEINDLSTAFLETINKNHDQDIAFRQEAVSGFNIFYKNAIQKLHGIRINIKRNVMTCNAGGILTTLSNECAMLVKRLEETRDVMLQRQRDNKEIYDRLNKNQQPSDKEMNYCEEWVWDKLRQRIISLSNLSIFFTWLLGIWLIIGFMSDWSCSTEDNDELCSIFVTLSSRYPIILITFALLFCLSPADDLLTAPPPPHVLDIIRQEVAAQREIPVPKEKIVVWFIALPILSSISN